MRDHPFMVGTQFHPEFRRGPTGRTRCSATSWRRRAATRCESGNALQHEQVLPLSQTTGT